LEVGEVAVTKKDRYRVQLTRFIWHSQAITNLCDKATLSLAW
jgi:hypothetical protein